jgi:hypothetical protein
MIWATIYLVPSDTKILEIYLLRNHKNITWWIPIWQSLNFHESHTYYLGNKSFHIYVACFCIDFWQALLIPYKRFVMPLKLKSCTHHPHMHYSYIWVRCKNMPSIRSIHKCFTPTLGVNTKTYLLDFPSTK